MKTTNSGKEAYKYSKRPSKTSKRRRQKVRQQPNQKVSKTNSVMLYDHFSKAFFQIYTKLPLWQYITCLGYIGGQKLKN